MKKTHCFKQAILPCLMLAASNVMAAEPSHLEMPHSKGTFMIEYKYMHMNMDGLRAGTTDVSTAEATAMNGEYNYMMVPTKMTMDMHMIMPMYNLTRDTSVMLMGTYLSNKMDMENRMGGTMDMESSGVGDTEISINHKFGDDMFAVGFGLSIPTGDIDVTLNMTMPMVDVNGDLVLDGDGNPRLMQMTPNQPFNHQLGSGTYDVTPSLTYLGAYYDLRYGAQGSYKYRIGENDNDYTLGDVAKFKAWIRKPVFGIQLEAELDIKKWGSIDGEDAKSAKVMRMINPNSGMLMQGTAAPTNFAKNYGGTMASVSIGANIPVAMLTFGVDVIMPVYQDLNGLQMKNKMSLAGSVSAMF